MSIEDDLIKQYNESKHIINQAQNDGQLVIFVGAGASMSAGMPSWQQAVKKIADRLGIEKYSAEDYLRIPQYYYNSRGKKEYTQLIQDIFLYQKCLSSQKVHDQIIGFNTQTIITTNYDNLLEQAAEKNSEMIRVISKDSDLPYRKTGRELIKIHGDFENDNFVLKEEDYLAYSRNFTLIENYIKSIIGTKVVLFIGYSFNDPDIKQIFSWAKDILHGDFQPAYLIDTGNNYNLNIDTYFKNFGVNVLYSSVQLGDDYCVDQTKNLEYMLEWLLDQGFGSKLEELHNRLSVFRELNYSYSSYVESAFRKTGFYTDWGYIVADNAPGLKKNSKDYEILKHILEALAYERYIQNPSAVYVLGPKDTKICYPFKEMYTTVDDDNGLVKEILDVLNKSSINGIILFVPVDDEHPRLDEENIYWEKQHRVIIDFEELKDIPKWLDYIYHFDDKALKAVSDINTSKLNESNPELYLEQACIHSYFDEYLAAYNCLRTAASLFYRYDKKANYYIAETCRYYIGKLIKSNGFILGITKEDIDDVSKEIEAVDLDRTFISLPDLGKGSEILKEISSFDISYKLFHEAFKYAEDIREQAKTRYNIFTGLPAFSKMRNRIYDFYFFESMNYIILDKYVENNRIYKLYFQSILSSAISPDLGNDENEDEPSNIHIKSLSGFDLFLGLKYVTYKEFQELYSDIESLDIDESGHEYLKDVLKCSEMQPKHRMFSRDNPFWKIIILLGHVKHEKAIFEIAISKLCNSSSGINYLEYKNVIIKFIDNAETSKVIDSDTVSYVHTLLANVLGYLANCKQTESIQLSSLIYLLAYICQKHDYLYDDEELICKLFNGNARKLCLEIYPLIGQKSQKVIFVNDVDWSNINSVEEYKQYCIAVGNGIIRSNEKIERIILEYCKTEKGKKETEKGKNPLTISIGFSDPEYVQLLGLLCDLFLRGYIINKNDLVDTVKAIGEPFTTWLIDLDGFDYSQFKLEWINRCYIPLLKRIANNDNAKEGVSKRIAEEYAKGRVDKRIMKKYFSIFVDPKNENDT